MRHDGTRKTQITSTPGFELWSRWSPSDYKIAFGTQMNTEVRHADIWMVDLEKLLGKSCFQQ